MGARDPREYETILTDKFRERFSKRWYYSIELEPGRWTNGEDHKNIALTRKLLSRCEIEGKDCIDVACADGMIPTLLHRRGAKRIVGCDRNDFGSNIRYLKKMFGFDFEYLPNIKQPEITEFSNRQERPGFDVVVNSGLLYHVFNTIGMMAHSRGLIRTGGVMIVETAGSAIDDFAEFFNAEGRVSKDPSTFWFPTIKMIEYMGRMLRMEPIDAIFSPIAPNPQKVLRFAIAFRAVDYYPTTRNDGWVQESYQARDYMDLIDWSILDQPSVKVGYDAPSRLPRNGHGIDAMALLRKTGTYAAPLDEVRLPLGVMI